MKSLYLFFWALSAIFLAIYTPYFKNWAPIYAFNCIIPILLLIIRIVFLHKDEDKNMPI